MEITDLAKLTPSAVAFLREYRPLIDLSQKGVLGFDADGLWVFQGNGEDSYRPARDPHGTGTSAVVISNDKAWFSGSEYSTAQFPQLQVLIYSDATRGVDNTLLKKDQKTKAYAIFGAIDAVLHDVRNKQHDLFGVPILRCVRSGGPAIDPVPNTSGVVRLSVRYDVTLMR